MANWNGYRPERRTPRASLALVKERDRIEQRRRISQRAGRIETERSDQ